eukprot:g19494.t1
MPRAKPIQCVETGEIFPSVSAAAKWIAETQGKPHWPAHIFNALRTGQRTAGYHFQRLEDMEGSSGNRRFANRRLPERCVTVWERYETVWGLGMTGCLHARSSCFRFYNNMTNEPNKQYKPPQSARARLAAGGCVILARGPGWLSATDL